MTLYLLRHGLAAERDASRYPEDDARPLTREGVHKMKQLAAKLKAAGLKFDVIWSSPLIRARQTAEIVAQTFRMGDKLRLSQALAPDGDVASLIRRLGWKKKSSRAMLWVGHEPDLSRLASVLLTGGAQLPLTLKKGGLCKLEVTRLRYGSCATLEWLISPRILLGRTAGAHK